MVRLVGNEKAGPAAGTDCSAEGSRPVAGCILGVVGKEGGSWPPAKCARFRCGMSDFGCGMSDVGFGISDLNGRVLLICVKGAPGGARQFGKLSHKGGRETAVFRVRNWEWGMGNETAVFA